MDQLIHLGVLFLLIPLLSRIIPLKSYTANNDDYNIKFILNFGYMELSGHFICINLSEVITFLVNNLYAP